MTNLDVVTVILMDQDTNLGGKHNVIHKFEDVVVTPNEPEHMILLKLAMDGSFKTALEMHNKKRSEINNPQTLERHGVEVKLQPITIDKVTMLIK